MSFLDRIAQSKVIEIVLTVLVYCIYTAVIAASIAPSVWLLLTVLPGLIGPAVSGQVAAHMVAVQAAVVLAGALYLYVFFGSIFQAGMVRLLSLGIKPGRYPAISLTTIRWLIYSGIYTISIRTILPLIPVTFAMNMYFRIIGCRMGRNVKLMTFMLNDAYLLTIEDDVIIGGNTDVSCHLFENNQLILKPIHIGKGSLIGANSYISPGVRIGARCVVGLSSYIRSDHVIPDGSIITSLAGIDVRTAREIERGHLGLNRRARPGRKE